MEIEHFVAPSYADLRPFRRTPTSDKFPVHHDLVEQLLANEERADSDPDQAVAHTMVVCSSYAYSDVSTLGSIMARMGLESNHCLMVAEYVDVLFLTSTAYLVQSRDGRVVILCYRGTPPTSLITWLTDLEVDPVKIAMPSPSAPRDEEVDVHGGFYRNVRSTRYEILHGLQRAIAGKSVLPDGAKLDHELEALYITGHSLGGASAAMLAAMLLTDTADYKPVVERLRAVYTFGAPMIGSPKFADACEAVPFLADRVIRYVYASDIVPQVPPTESGRFKHFGREYQYNPPGPGGSWRHNKDARTQTSNLAGILTTPLSFLAKSFTVTRHIRFRASINDHLPQYYIAALTPPGVRSEFGD